MKICHVTDFLPKYHHIWGGAELAAANIVDLLGARGVTQAVLSTKPQKPVKEKYDFYPVPVLNDYFGKFAELVKLWTFDPLSFVYVTKALKKIAPDVLHLHNFRTISFSAVAAAKKMGIPVVFSIYDNWCLCPNHTLITKANEICKAYHGLPCLYCTSVHKKVSALFRKPLFNHFLNKIDTFIVLSRTMAEVLEDYGIDRKKIEFVPLPLSKETWQSDTVQQAEIEPASVLFCGWVAPHKGLKILVQAFLEVVKRVPQAKLCVLETGVVKTYKDSVLDFIHKNNLERHICFLGKKNNDEVQKYLGRCELVVVPEQWGIAWPIFLSEAMFAQKPIIASRIGDIPFFIKEGANGYTVNPTDPKEFSEKIIYCLEHRDLTAAFGKESRKRITEICNNENIYDKLIGIYKNDLNARRG